MTALLATMLVVVLLLSALSFVLLDLGAPVPDDDDDDGDGGAPPTGWLTIDEDTTWQGVNASIGGPVRIEDGSTLTLERCDLTVDIEDLVLWRAPVFDVRQGGGLALNGSRVRLRVDQNLSGALYVGGDARFEYGYPHVSRVVNLLHAKRPVLAFNVSFRGSTTDLVVLGQRSWDGQMGQLARLPGRSGVWEHHEVDLSPVAGGVARVAIAPLDRGFGALYLSDARVLDGGATPTGELPIATGECFEGWEREGLDQFLIDGGYSYHIRLDALVESGGDVRLEDSTLEAPAGLPRMRDIEDGSRDWSDREMMGDSMYHRSLIWAHVQLSGGTLDVTGSRLLNVPVRADGARLSIEGSRLAGDADLLTLRRCDGGARDTDFHREPYAFAEFESSERSRESWAISVEELGAGPITLDRCTVEGAALGLYLKNASVGVNGCAYANSTVTCLWSRDSAIAGGWERLNATCTFDQKPPPEEGVGGVRGPRLRFLEVHGCRSTITWFRMPADMDRSYYVYMPPDAVPVSELVSLVDQLDDDYLLLLPRLVVTAEGTERTYGQVPVVVNYHWGERMNRQETRTIEQGASVLALRFDLGTVGGDDYRRSLGQSGLLTCTLDKAFAPGAVVLSMMLNTYSIPEEIDLTAAFVRVVLDGATVCELEVLHDGMMVDDSNLHLEKTLEVPPGAHNVSVELQAPVPTTGLYDSLWNMTFGVVRADRSMPPEEVKPLLRRYCWLLVDPDVTVVLNGLLMEEIEYSELYVDYHIDLGVVWGLLWPGASLSVEGVTGAEDTEVEIYLDVDGPGNLSVTDCSDIYISIVSASTTVTLDRIFNCLVSLDLASGAGHMGPDCSVRLALTQYGGAIFHAEGSKFRESPWTSRALSLQGASMSATFTNCTFMSDLSMEALVSMSSGGSVLFQGCSFVNTPLRLHNDINLALPSSCVLDNSTFAGNLSFLVVEDFLNETMVSCGLELTTTNVTFDGTGTGALVGDGHVAEVLNCTFRPGAALLRFHPYTIGEVQGDEWDYYTGFNEVITLYIDDSLPFYDASQSTSRMGLVFEAVVGEVPYAYDGRTVTFALVEDGDVVWFVESPIAGNVVEAEVPDWKDASYLVQQAIGRISGNVDWWIDWP